MMSTMQGQINLTPMFSVNYRYCQFQTEHAVHENALDE